MRSGVAVLALFQCAIGCVAVFRVWHPHPMWRLPVAFAIFLMSLLAASFEVGAWRGWMGRKPE